MGRQYANDPGAVNCHQLLMGITSRWAGTHMRGVTWSWTPYTPRVSSALACHARVIGTILAAVVVAARCGSSPTAPGPTDAETLELRLTTAHFRLFAGRTSAAAVQSAADALERQYARVLIDLNVTSTGPITVQIWQ